MTKQKALHLYSSQLCALIYELKIELEANKVLKQENNKTICLKGVSAMFRRYLCSLLIVKY